jgi:hypothetical protein
MTDREPIAMHEGCELVLTVDEMVAYRAVMIDSRGTVGQVDEPGEWIGTGSRELWCELHECFVEFSFIETIDPADYRLILEEAEEARAADDA